MLHDGCVIPIDHTNLLLLPNSKRLIQVKITSKEIMLLERLEFNYIPKINKLHRREVYVEKRDRYIVLYKISEQGIFQVIKPKEKSAESC